MMVSMQAFAAGAAALLGAFCLGWLLNTREAAPPQAARVLSMEVLSPGAPRELIDRISALDGGTIPDWIVAPRPLQTVQVAPDISRTFREDLAAIEQTQSGPIIWLVDLEQLSGRRAVRVGEVYKDGWRLSAISAQMIELRKNRDHRQVAVFDTLPAIAE
jgi:hypothetical protein